MEALRSVTTVIRNDRSQSGRAPRVPARLSIDGVESGADSAAGWLTAPSVRPLLWSLSRTREAVSVERLPALASKQLTRGIRFAIEFEEEAETKHAPDATRARAELAEVEANLERVRARLANPGFTDKAPAAVVEGARRQLVELEQRRSRLAGPQGGEGGP